LSSARALTSGRGRNGQASNPRAVRIWFCAAVALIAASIADPLVESASNAHWFGPGNFTDHSTWDVIPALLAGLVFVGLYLLLRIRNSLAERGRTPGWLRRANDALGQNILRLVPLICVAELIVLYLMETAEQRFVYSRIIGGTLWLGGPIVVSVTVHAASCAIVAFVAAKSLRALADATIRLVLLIHSFVATTLRRARATFIDLTEDVGRICPSGVLGHVGERAPPIPVA
jgi:hypothetical protein